MKIINRSTSSKKIQWFPAENSNEAIAETVLRFKDLILSQGTKAFKLINDELSLNTPSSFKVKQSELLKAESLIRDDLKQSILNSTANIQTVCENGCTKVVVSVHIVCAFWCRSQSQVHSTGKVFKYSTPCTFIVCCSSMTLIYNH